MRFPARIIWDLVGDVFENIFKDDSRRPVELLWQGLAEISGDAFGYTDYYKKSRNLFEVEPFAPWGIFPSSPQQVDTTSQVNGTILGLRGSDWIALTENGGFIPEIGSFSLFDSSVSYFNGTTSSLLSSGGVSTMQPSNLLVEWDAEDNPSFVFGPDTSLDGTQRWLDEGSPALTPQSDGILFRPQWSNWAIISDKFYFSGDQDWEQLWRLRVDEWENTDGYTRAMSVSSFGDVGANFEVRLQDDGSTVSVSSGMYAKTKYVTLNIDSSGFITRTNGSFLSDGFRPGMTLNVQGSLYNSGNYTISSVTTTQITIEDTFSFSESVSDVSLTTSLEPAVGNTNNWRTTLLAASPSNPVYVEFLVRYNAATSEIFSEVYLGDSSVEQANPYSVAPGRRRQKFDVFNEIRDVRVVLDFMAATDGKLWESGESLDFSTDIGDSFSFVYQIPEPLVNATRIQWEPFDLTPPADVITSSATKMTLELDEEYNEYAPEYARLEYDGEFIIAEKIDQIGSIVTYGIISRSSPGVSFTAEVNIHPWYITEARFEFIGPGIFTTETPLPFDLRQCYFVNSEAEELDMYNRYGKLLRMPERPDSQEYLDTLRGMQFGLLSPHTPDATSRGLGILAGLPYTTEKGFIEDVNRVTNEFGAALYDEVTVNGRVFRASPYWENVGLLLPVGSFLEKLTPLTKSVNVYDWKSNLELVQDVVDVWRTWGTFVVQIPASVGLSTEKAGDFIRYLDRTKGIHTDYVVEYYVDEFEDLFNDTFDDIETAFPETIAHTLEDMVFDDHGEVVVNPLDFYGGSPFYGEERQLSSNLALDQGIKLDQFEALDAESLRVFDVQINHNGVTMGGDSWADRPDAEYFYKNQGIELNRPLTIDEDPPFSRSTLRVSPLFGFNGESLTFYNRPYSLFFPFTSASPEFSARDGGGALASLTNLAYEDISTAGISASILTDVYHANTNWTVMVGSNGAIFTSSDYGETFTDRTVATAEDFSGVHKSDTGVWMVGSGDLIYVQEIEANAPIAQSIVVGSDHAAVHFPSGQIGYVVSTAAGNTVIYKTTDGGLTWGAGVTVAVAENASDVNFIDDTNGWVSSTSGLYQTSDGGATWSTVKDAGAFLAVWNVDANTVVAVGTAGLARISTDGGTTFGDITLPGESPGDFASISYDGTRLVLAGGVAATNGQVFTSVDRGGSWTIDTVGTVPITGIDVKPTWPLVFSARNFAYRLR